MTKTHRTFAAIAVIVSGLGLGLAACDQDGPAEEMGENIDETMEDAGDAMEDAGEAMEEQN